MIKDPCEDLKEDFNLFRSQWEDHRDSWNGHRKEFTEALIQINTLKHSLGELPEIAHSLQSLPYIAQSIESIEKRFSSHLKNTYGIAAVLIVMVGLCSLAIILKDSHKEVHITPSGASITDSRGANGISDHLSQQRDN